MNKLKKSLVLLVAFHFTASHVMASGVIASGVIASQVMSWPTILGAACSYGIKVAGATSFSIFNEKLKEKFNEQLRAALPGSELNNGLWNPWFGVALYIEGPINNHIGLGAELLYNRFEQVCIFNISVPGNTGVAKLYMPICHTIGVNKFITWYWTGAIRPDFKDDYFLGRLFVGLHAFYCFKSTQKPKCLVDGKEFQIPHNNVINRTFSEIELTVKLGFIGGISLEFPSGLLLELKSIFPYNLLNEVDDEARPFVSSLHLSVGYNFAKFC